MTAAKLHSLPPHREPYTGGMSLATGDRVDVRSQDGWVTLAPNINLDGGRGYVTLPLDLTPDESAELRLALEQAEKAAKS